MATDSSNRQGVRAVATTTTDPQRSEKRAVAARGAAGALALSILAVVLQSAATATPTWGYFTNPDAGSASEKGYFGPWRQCKLLLYGRERCGQGVSRFQPVLAVWVAGLAAAAASALLAILVGLAILQLAMASSAKRVLISYSTALIGKVALATLATSLAIVAASLFALQTDDRASSFVITRGEAFYMQICVQWMLKRMEILWDALHSYYATIAVPTSHNLQSEMMEKKRRSLLREAKDEIELDKMNKQKQGKLAAIALNFSVLVAAVYEGIYARRGGDPTKIRVVGDPRATTINNPGYREHQPTNGGTISMTDASGKPYVGGAGNGSMASVATSGSVASTASPLRSSLKKPKPLGIHNPGFSAHSPTLSRNGSQKKVRIQTHSTEV